MSEKQKEIMLKMMAELKNADAIAKKIKTDAESADKSVDNVEKENK